MSHRFKIPNPPSLFRHTESKTDQWPLLLENPRSPGLVNVPLFRIDGSFPSFSPDGARITYVGLPGLYVVNADGTGAQRCSCGKHSRRRGTGSGRPWSTRALARSSLRRRGRSLLSLSTSIESVFRSARSGHKNLYVMDAEEGERASLRRLTVGPWTDTMCNWSPDGEWIVFVCDRDNPGGGGFVLYLIRPNGTGLEKVVESGDGGGPDSKSVVFTSDYAAVTAKPIANPHHHQPYGDIFTVRLGGGEGVRQLTHNSYEDGTRGLGACLYEAERCGGVSDPWLGVPIR
ncbi:hypothetical protein QJS10_CPB13g00748 [Acorus calamus]|uniref:Uncharacterized protein n=1 Tax=Acorus calamus TaxID=4465 RepID=A0AAV9DJ49_ACOCL|nr:hypothetical protein QJS10_CPB13g00748 [Acorus calamus]